MNTQHTLNLPKIPQFDPHLAIDDPDNTNAVRAERGFRAYQKYRECAGITDIGVHREYLSDLIADVLHLANEQGHSIQEVLDSAISYFIEDSTPLTD